MSKSSTRRSWSIGAISLGLVVGASISAVVTIVITNAAYDLRQATSPTAERTADPTDEVSRLEGSKPQEAQPLVESDDTSTFENPNKAWNTLINDGVEDIAQLRTLLKVAAELVQQEGITVLDLINDSNIDKSILDTIMKSIAQNAALKDPQSIFQEAMHLSHELQAFVLPEIVKTWASLDPLVAFDAISNLNKSGLRASLQGTLIGAWAQHDPQNILDSLKLLPERLRTKAEELAVLAIARSSPADAVQFLDNMDDPSRKLELEKTIAKYWAQLDVYEALNWVTSTQFSDEATRFDVFSLVIRELAEKDPELALQTALNQPLYESVFGFERGLEEIVIEQVAKFDLDRAIGMLPQVRVGDSQIDTYNTVGRELVMNGEYDRALALGQELSEEERKRYLSTVLSLWAQEEPETMFESIDNILATPEIKKQAAATLLAKNILMGESVFDEDQVEHLTNLAGVGGEPTIVHLGELDSSLLRRGDNVIISRSPGAIFPADLDPKEMQKSLQKTLEESLGKVLEDIQASGGSVEVKTEMKTPEIEDSD